MKSAQATRAWLESHLEHHREVLGEVDEVTKPYPKFKELREAVVAAGEEVDRATAVAAAVGLLLDSSKAFEHAATMMAGAEAPPSRRWFSWKISQDYVLGIDVVGALYARQW
jgi:hypothetical protein